MARRKRRGASVGDVTVIVALAGGVLMAAFVAMVISVIVHSSVLLLLVLAGGGGLIAWKVKARTDRRRAVEAYQTRLEIERQREAAIYAERAQAIESYHAMTAWEFEEALAWLCRRDGCPEAHVSGKAGDLGADVQAITPDGRLLVIQAKRYVPGTWSRARPCRGSAGPATTCTAPTLPRSLPPRGSPSRPASTPPQRGSPCSTMTPWQAGLPAMGRPRGWPCQRHPGRSPRQGPNRAAGTPGRRPKGSHRAVLYARCLHVGACHVSPVPASRQGCPPVLPAASPPHQARHTRGMAGQGR